MGALITRACEMSQIIIVTHSAALVAAVTELAEADVGLLRLVKDGGQTVLEGQGLLDEPAWHWPDR